MLPVMLCGSTTGMMLGAVTWVRLAATGMVHCLCRAAAGRAMAHPLGKEERRGEE